MSIKSDIFRSHLSPDFDLNERYFEPEFVFFNDIFGYSESIET